MKKEIISTSKAPQPIGPYNQAILVGNTLYMSGQIALNPKTMTLELDNIADETRRVMTNLEAVLAAADMKFDHVVKTSIFLKDMQQFSAVNEIYGQFFDEATAPARETVQVAMLPKDVNVEISMIAMR